MHAVKAALGAAVATALLTAGCSSSPSPQTRPHLPQTLSHPAKTGTQPAKTGTHLVQPWPPAPMAMPSSPPVAGSPATIEHWGSFFGAKKGVNYDTAASPVALTVPGTVAEIGTSNSTQYALLTNGSLYAWGLGTEGELGDGGTVNSFTRPVRVNFPPGVKIASIPADVMPFDAALAVDTKGNVWGWGQNRAGELCLGSGRVYTTPVKLPLTGVTAVAGASTHAVYDAHGTVYSCGGNLAGDLGDASRRSSSTPVRVSGLGGSPVIELVASFAGSGALLANGEYFDWGYDGDGQLGDGRFGRSSDVPVRVKLPDPVRQVAQGGSIWGNGQTLVLLSNGELWSWGANFHGQLGAETTESQALPVRFYPPARVTYESLASSGITSYAVSSAGNVYAWGGSPAGQVGDGTLATTLIPALVASGATMISSTADNVAVVIGGRT
jgi:alpha-tubulin suppressor-like RCC1 family protein